jgi:hypothetical protein
MREATSGSDIPHATYTWANADQAVAAYTAFTPAAISVPGATPGNGQPIVTARAALPAIAGTLAKPSISAWISAAGQVTISISNQTNAALVATGTAITLDIQVMPIIP